MLEESFLSAIDQQHLKCPKRPDYACIQNRVELSTNDRFNFPLPVWFVSFGNLLFHRIFGNLPVN